MNATTCRRPRAYRSRFGSLLRAYQLIGYSPGRDYDYVEINRLLRSMHQRVLNDAVEGIERAGGHVSIDGATDLLTVNDEFTTSVVIARASRCRPVPAAGRSGSTRPCDPISLSRSGWTTTTVRRSTTTFSRESTSPNPVSISRKRTGSWSTRTAATRFEAFYALAARTHIRTAA